MTSAVTRTSAAFAARSTAIVCADDTWQTCSRAPASRASAQSRATIVSSAVAGHPASPSCAATTPSWACAPAVSRWSSACWAITASSDDAYSSARRITTGSCTQRPSSENIAHPRAGRGHRAELGHPLAAQPDGDGADRMDVDEPGLLAEPAHVLDDDRGVGDGVGVGHREDGGVAAERGGGRARGDGLGLLAAGLAQVGVQVDEAGQQHEAVGVEGLRGAAGPAGPARSRRRPRRGPGRRPARPRRRAGRRGSAGRWSCRSSREQVVEDGHPHVHPVLHLRQHRRSTARPPPPARSPCRAPSAPGAAPPRARAAAPARRSDSP